MRIEALAPRGAGIREEDIDMVRRLADLPDKPLDLVRPRAVGGDRDGSGSGPLVGQCVELRDGFGARIRFARRDVHFCGAGLKEPDYG